ncbi:MAG: hypothetical protein K2H86_05825 [Muribaculaceae bacterium]|nr:hypothetical protein [Muribaculaceae bacterium]
MKKVILSVLLLSVLMLPMCVNAAVFPTFSFNLKDNTMLTFPSANIEMIYVDGILNVTTGADTQAIPVSDIKSMQFTSVSTNVVESVISDTEDVEIYTLTGIRLGHFSHLRQAQAQLPSGIYIANQSGTSVKVKF